MRRALTLAAAALVLVSAGASGQTPYLPWFTHVVVIVMENKEVDQVIGNRHAPRINALARKYTLLSNYDAVSHPSLPDYLALVSGSTQGVHSDCTSCHFRAKNLADTLEEAGMTWKTYAEGLPRPGFTGAYAGRYAKKHDPLIYFDDVASSARRRAQIVPLRQLRKDLAAGALPDFSLVVPDLCHDMHDCSVATGDRWLGTFVRGLLASPELDGAVVFVVFDEGTTADGGGGHVPAMALGSTVKTRLRANGATSHYGLLRTIEDAWGLKLLGRTYLTRPIRGIWK
jgi:phospholipase C